MGVAQDISALRKANQLDQALALSESALAQDPHNPSIRGAYGWVLFSCIKADLQAYEAKRMPPSTVGARLERHLKEYARTRVGQGPDLLHSQILTQVLKLKAPWPMLLSFLRWWDPALLRDEDRQPYQPEGGRPLPSLALRLDYAIGRALIQQQTSAGARLAPDLLDWARAHLEASLQRHPDDPWLNYYKSQLLLEAGELEAARARLLPVVRRQPKASWAWNLLGRTWETTDAQRAILCYQRAVQVAGQPTEVVNTRVRLAELLSREQRFEAAAAQVKRALRSRTQAGYSIPQTLQRLSQADWFQPYLEQTDMEADADVARAARDLIAPPPAELRYRLGVLDHQNVAKSLAYIAFAPDDGVALHYDKFPDLAEVTAGTLLEVGFAPGSQRPQGVRASDQTRIPSVCESYQGRLEQPEGRTFAFVQAKRGPRVFVPPALSAAHTGLRGSRVACIALASRDKQGRPSWRALRIDPKP